MTKCFKGKKCYDLNFTVKLLLFNRFMMVLFAIDKIYVSKSKKKIAVTGITFVQWYLHVVIHNNTLTFVECFDS